MARIRTIKPEFWTDEKIVGLPFEARLLFIGLWNFCDDDGFLDDSPTRLKLQIFPADNVDVDQLIDILCIEELVVRGESESGYVLCIPHFTEHQRVSHPTKSQWKDSFQQKQPISRATRRQVAEKYKCPVNGQVDVNCYSCGRPGGVYWRNSWVGFTKLELSHFIPESSGGLASAENIVLCCRYCNRSMHTSDVLSHISKRIPESSGVLRPERNGRELNGIDPDRSVGAEPDRIEKAVEKERNRADMIASIPSLTESALIAVDPLPAKSLAAGAFAALQDEHLSNARSLTEWFKRQLSLPDPVCGHTRADLLLILAAGLHAAKMPSNKVKKTRCAVFVNVVTRGRWRQVTRHLREAEINLLEFEKSNDPTPPKAN